MTFTGNDNNIILSKNDLDQGCGRSADFFLASTCYSIKQPNKLKTNSIFQVWYQDDGVNVADAQSQVIYIRTLKEEGKKV